MAKQAPGKKASTGEPQKAKGPWTAQAIQKVVMSTGKPLEVLAAMAFIRKAWRTSINTYYTDVITGDVRELDVLAEKKTYYIDNSNKRWSFAIQVHVSCRGFPSECRPIVFTIDHSIPLEEQVSLLGHSWSFGNPLLTQTAKELAEDLFPMCDRITSFGVLEENKEGKIEWKGDRRMKGGQDSLFPALDSAIKSAAYYWGLDAQIVDRHRLYIPILVLSKSWFEVSLRGGGAELQEPTERGYNVIGYPFRGDKQPPLNLIAIVTTINHLPEVITGIDNIYFKYQLKVQKVGDEGARIIQD